MEKWIKTKDYCGYPHWKEESDPRFTRVYFINSKRYCYFYDGGFHRLEGPANIDHGEPEWWYYGKQVPCSSQQEFEQMIKLKAFW